MKNSPDSPDTVFIVDASIYIFQAHFSPYIECSDEQGNDLSALYGFMQFLLQFLRRVRPSHLAVAMDESLFCGFRHTLCDDYKSNRELPDENLAMQLAACTEVCQALGVPAFSSREYEADDIIGTLSHRIRAESNGKAAIHILSRDKDLAQLLVSTEDCLWDYAANRKRYVDDIVSEYGIHPTQFPDYLGLTGDAVDCIRGVPGVGPVKARALLQEFGSLESLYDNLDRVADLPLRGAGKLAAVLEAHRDLAQLSKRLATIVCDVASEEEHFSLADIDAITLRPTAVAALEQFLQDYAFTSGDASRLLGLAGRLGA